MVLDSLVLSALFCVQCELYLACNCPRFVYLECRISRLVCQGAVFSYIMSKLCLSCFKMVVCAQGALSRMSKIHAYWTKVHLSSGLEGARFYVLFSFEVNTHGSSKA